jgi:hypothetical protein
MLGRATTYELRWTTSPPALNDTLTWWDNAPGRKSWPVTTNGGTQDSVKVSLSPGTYYFVICTADEVPNWACGDAAPNGGWSNVAEVLVPAPPDTSRPFPVRDLRGTVP